mmetsp:Transcript_30015/g.58918  ORF Transcript_30015/g.58918 Transcript_30015/m.58918 type:complete len:92 (-) Transcript_30015:443-718(-)
MDGGREASCHVTFRTDKRASCRLSACQTNKSEGGREERKGTLFLERKKEELIGGGGLNGEERGMSIFSHPLSFLPACLPLQYVVCVAGFHD